MEMSQILIIGKPVKMWLYSDFESGLNESFKK